MYLVVLHRGCVLFDLEVEFATFFEFFIWVEGKAKICFDIDRVAQLLPKWNLRIAVGHCVLRWLARRIATVIRTTLNGELHSFFFSVLRDLAIVLCRLRHCGLINLVLFQLV